MSTARADPEQTQVTLRPITEADRNLLYCVYASTRQEELELTGWDDAQKTTFLQMQFNAQHAHYVQHYQGAQFQVIEVGGAPAGRLYVHRRPDEIRVVDIALLPEFRNCGIGSALLRDILAEGQGRGVPVTIHVEVFNPAQRLYARLGFRRISDDGPYMLMEWGTDRADAATTIGTRNYAIE